MTQNHILIFTLAVMSGLFTGYRMAETLEQLFREIENRYLAYETVIFSTLQLVAEAQKICDEELVKELKAHRKNEKR